MLLTLGYDISYPDVKISPLKFKKGLLYYYIYTFDFNLPPILGILGSILAADDMVSAGSFIGNGY